MLNVLPLFYSVYCNNNLHLCGYLFPYRFIMVLYDDNDDVVNVVAAVAFVVV